MFNPRIPKSRRRNGDKPLFPGYMFAYFDLDSGIWARVSGLPGVRSLVEIGGGPYPVPAGVVDVLRQRCGAPAEPALKPGDPVRIVHGPLSTLEAIFQEGRSGAERVTILLSFMSRQVTVHLSPCDLAAVV